MLHLVILPLLFATVSCDSLGAPAVIAHPAISYHNTYKAPQRHHVVAAPATYPATYAASAPIVAANAPVVAAHSPLVAAHSPLSVAHTPLVGAASAISYHNTYKAPQRHHVVAAPATYPATYAASAPVVAAHSPLVAAHSPLVASHSPLSVAHTPLVGAASAISYHNTYKAPQRHHLAAPATYPATYAAAATYPATYATPAPLLASHAPLAAAHGSLADAHASLLGVPSAISYHNTYKVSQSRHAVPSPAV